MTDPIAPLGAKPLSLNDSQEYYAAAMTYLGKSIKAGSIISSLNGCNWDVWVYITAEMEPCFMEYEFCIQHNVPASLAIWCPTGKITAAIEGVPTLQSPAIGLLHELGHAAQWVNNRGWYLAYMDKIRAGDPAKKGTPAYNSKMVVENDNIDSNETPVCVELGEGKRNNYNDSYNFQAASKNYKAPYPLRQGGVI